MSEEATTAICWLSSALVIVAICVSILFYNVSNAQVIARSSTPIQTGCALGITREAVCIVAATAR